MTGCGQRPRETERAPDAKEINMPADNKQRVSLARCGGRNAGSHVSPQLSGRRGYSARVTQPWRIQPSRGSASASGGRCWQSHQVPPGHFSWCCWRQDKQIINPLSSRPTGRRSGHHSRPRPTRRRSGHHYPGGRRAAGPAAILARGRRAAGPAAISQPDDARGLPGQAAFARRIRRRRSADRSSSFSPPQVPYFSGRPTA